MTNEELESFFIRTAMQDFGNRGLATHASSMNRVLTEIFAKACIETIVEHEKTRLT